jgi:outer membrane biosynthesis protein TonB
MAATKIPNKTSTPTKAKSAPANTPAKPPAQAAAKASFPVSEAVEAPKPEAALEAAPVAKPEPTPEPVAVVAIEPTPEPEAAPAAVREPEVAPEPEPEEEAGVAIDEGVEQLASLAEQVINEAEAIAGEAAHNFQIALKAATGAQGVVPTLNGINSYLHRSVQINSQFMEQFSTVRSPVDLVQLQMRFLEEHRLAMLDFAQQWMAKKSAS